jgi:hypothetical protein
VQDRPWTPLAIATCSLLAVTSADRSIAHASVRLSASTLGLAFAVAWIA